jgi:AraC-like DNA-binding protein
MIIEQLVAILQNSAAQFHCPDFGLRLGAKQDFRILGPLGLLLKNCITPRQTLNAARGFIAFHNQSEYWDYTEQGHNLYLKRYEIFHDLADTRQYKELSLSACYQLCRLLMGDGFRGTRIEISHAPLYKQAAYEKYFKMPVLFNCEQDQLVIPAHSLDAPIPNADQTIHAFAEHYLVKFNQQNLNDTVQQVSSLIQQTMSDQNQSIDNIANLLGISRRTLQRRLSQQGATFKALLHNIRIKTACWYLTSSTIDMTLLSEMLGYSDISGFSRAFKQAKGHSPLSWRKIKHSSKID